LKPLIAVLTDYGLKDHYVGLLKAVIKNVCPDAEVIDITHYIPKYNIALAAHVLKISRKYFPKNTVFLAVVDPGVGSSRRNLIIKSSNYVYVGPDNGLLIQASEDDGHYEAYEIILSKVALPKVSKTFHGRDIYAPAAALIACGVSVESLGVSIPKDSLVRVRSCVTTPREVFKEVFEVDVLHVDDFGNVVTSVTREVFEKTMSITLGDEVFVSGDMSSWFKAYYVETFSQVRRGELAIYEGSYEVMEVAVYEGSAKDILNIKDKIYLKRFKGV